LIETDEETIIKGLMETIKTIRKTNLETQKSILLEQREMKEIYKQILDQLKAQNNILSGSKIIEVLK